MPRIPRKCTTVKIRTRWSNRNHRFNPINTNRFNTMDTKMTDINRIDIVKPIPRNARKGLSLSCSYCKQDFPHPSPVNSDWSCKDWDGDKAKAKEQNKSWIDFEAPNQKTDRQKVTDTNQVPFSKPQTGQDDCKEEPFEVMESLVLLPPTSATSEDTTENTDEGLTDVEEKLQREEEKF